MLTHSPEEIRRQTQRLVFRCLSKFFCDESHNLAAAAQGDISDGMVLAMFSQERAGGQSIHSVAVSLSLPYETLRRRVQRLIDLGLLERNDRDVGPPSQFSKAVETRWLVTVDGFVAMNTDLANLGFAPAMSLASAAVKTLDAQKAAEIIDRIAVRAYEEAVPIHGSMQNAEMLTVLAYLNAAHFTLDEALTWRYAASGTPPPDNIRIPVSSLELARSMKLPRETVRRRLNDLVSAGRIERTGAGYLASQAYMSQPAIQAVAFATVQEYERVTLDLLKLSKAGAAPSDDVSFQSAGS